MFQASSSRQRLSLHSKANENQVSFDRYCPPARRKMGVLFFKICALFYVAPIKIYFACDVRDRRLQREKVFCV